MNKGINVYKKARKTSMRGMSQHALTMTIFKEINKNLELCNLAFEKRRSLTFNQFLEKKSVTLAKVCKYTTYMIETADRTGDLETVQLYDRIYHYILANATEANAKLDHDSVKRALLMSKELIKIWDLIPDDMK